MAIAAKIQSVIEKSSWIRKMFEEGGRLKALYGAENVFDFSLGNPNVPPPEIFEKTLRDILDSGEARDHGYMPNTGYPFVREAVAGYVAKEQGADVTAEEIIMTCGAAGALNATLKALLDPGDEVITPAPYFVEYGAYADNHGGVLKTVPTREDFTLNLDAMAAAITEKTKIILINSPNNPTGQIYDAASLEGLGRLMADRAGAMGRTIYLVSDEPYRKIVYDGATVPGIFGACPNSIIATSYSKELSIPGERLGYIAVNPAVEARESLLAALALTNRILGFVNAPALMQRVVARLQGVTVDVSEYDRKRRLLCQGLAACGYEFGTPPGAFYLFPKSPVSDDVAFVKTLQEERILVVPGSGFGGPGHFRISYCVDDQTITGAMPGFQRAIEKHQ